MLERMSEFFEKRIDGYDEHMLTEIESAGEFYPFTARLLPTVSGSSVLDLGCGTGLELEEYFRLNPTAKVTGIDLSTLMLERLFEKLGDYNLTLIHGSYFDLPLGEGVYDAAVSVESLHHFTKDEKIALYKRLHASLKEGGYFVLTDYFSLSDSEEAEHRNEYLALQASEGLTEGELYHYDTPLTVSHEAEALIEAGFSSVEVSGSWGQTFTLLATY